MKISTKLMIATIVILAFTTFGTIFVILTSQAFDKLNFESTLHDKVVMAITDFRAASRQITVEAYQSLYLSNGQDLKKFSEAVTVAKEKLSRLEEVDQIVNSANGAETEIESGLLRKNMEDLVHNLRLTLDLQSSGQAIKARQSMENTIENYFKVKYLNDIAKILTSANKKNQDIQQRLSAAAEKLAFVTPLGLMIVLFLSAVIFVPLTFSLKRKVSILLRYLYEFDFENNRFPFVPQEGKDEFSRIGRRFNELFVNLKTSKNQIENQQRDLLISSRMASLGEMSAGIAHEINNPLAVIVGNIQLLQKYMNPTDKFASKVELIDRSCKRIIKIVSGLKKFSRSGMQRELQRKSIVSIVKESLVLTEGKSKRHSTPISFEVFNDIILDCDEVEIEQVIVNLINNAVDAVKSNDERWVKILISVENNEGVLRVIDSGLGIPESVQEKIFDPFFTTKSVGQGTGLGLSITKGILEAHAATIAVLREHANTCFEIRFHKIHISSVNPVATSIV